MKDWADLTPDELQRASTTTRPPATIAWRRSPACSTPCSRSRPRRRPRPAPPEEPSVRIRSMTLDDAEAAAALSGELGYPADAAAIRARFAALDGRPEHGLLVAEDAGRVVGWVHAHDDWTLESGRTAELLGLVVTEARRGAGVGRALVAEAERWAAARGCAAAPRALERRARAHAPLLRGPGLPPGQVAARVRQGAVAQVLDLCHQIVTCATRQRAQVKDLCHPEGPRGSETWPPAVILWWGGTWWPRSSTWAFSNQLYLASAPSLSAPPACTAPTP